MRVWLAVLSLSCANLASAGDSALRTHLAAQQQAIELKDGRLAGAGAARLVQAAADARFVLIGEDHGFADVPEFAGALVRSLGADAPATLIVEVGPHSTRRIASALAAGRDRFDTLNQRYASAWPFLNQQEDVDLAARFVAHGPQHLVGIDQEFVLSPLLHLDALIEDASDTQRKALEAARTRAAEAGEAMVAQHDPSRMPLLALSADEWRALRDSYPRGTEGWQVLEDLAASTQIYQDQQTDPYASNHARALLMKREFMAWYRAAGPAPRAVIKLGAYHAGRGRSPVGVHDIGNLASELAESEGGRSLHVLVLVAGGTVNRWLSFVADESARQQAYDAAEAFEALGAGALLPLAQAHPLSVIDTESLRGRAWPEGTPEALRELAWHWDRVVLVREGRAATH